MSASTEKSLAKSFLYLTHLMATLRGDKGCPWDKKQTHESLIKYLREESFEVIEAIYSKNDDRLKDELGDLLLQVIFHAQVAKDRGSFQIGDVIERLSQKLLHRHPHVFDDDHKTSIPLDEQWENLKKLEKNTVCDGQDVSHKLSAYQKAENLQLKAHKEKFDWDHVDGVVDKIGEELGEFREAISEGNRQELEIEFGDLIFSVINLARFVNLSPEKALEKANDKFERRYSMMKELYANEEKELAFKKLAVAEKEKFWVRAKKKLEEDL